METPTEGDPIGLRRGLVELPWDLIHIASAVNLALEEAERRARDRASRAAKQAPAWFVANAVDGDPLVVWLRQASKRLAEMGVPYRAPSGEFERLR